MIERIKKGKNKLQKTLTKKFQKVVFKIEKTKWKTIKKVYPNYPKKLEAFYRKIRDKELKYAKTEEQKRIINNIYKFNVLLMRREFYTEKNNNYHMDMLNPLGMIDYLKVNKDIHMRWLKVDAIAMPVLITLLALGNTWAVPIIGITTLETLKNIKCVTQQNYKIEKIMKEQEKLERIANKRIDNREKKYGEAQKLISEKVLESEELPSMTEIIDNIQSKEQLEQLKQLIINEAKIREQRNKDNIKSIGGI